MKLKKGDKVQVITGKDRGTSGTIVRAFPKDDMVVIDGVNVVSKHRRATAQSRKGQVVKKTMPVHASNVMLLDPQSGKPTRVGITRGKDGARERVAKKSGKTL